MFGTQDREGIAQLPEEVEVEAEDEEGEGDAHGHGDESAGGEDEEDDVERRQDDHHEEHGVDGDVPPEVAGVDVEKVDNLEDDQLEHGAGEAEIDTEDELDDPVVELVVLEEHLDEEDPAGEEEDELADDDDDGVVDELHDDCLELVEL